MALPAGKKRGLRLLEHEGLRYYWKVKNDYAKAELDVLVGLENTPSVCFHIRVDFVDSSLYFPWMAQAHEQGSELGRINQVDKVSPKLIVEAINFVRTKGWPDHVHLQLEYKQNTFYTETK